MKHTASHKPTTTNGHQAPHVHSAQDHKICEECSEWMHKSAEKCRAWRERSESAVCKGGLATAAFVCDSLALSMETCMKMMDQKEPSCDRPEETLDGLVSTMNTATGSDKTDAIAAVVSELVSQRETIREKMTST
jgi:hypothetical protein